MESKEPPMPPSGETPEETGKKQEQSGESPIISFPKKIETLRGLQDKLTEYRKRLGTQVKENPHVEPILFTDTNYKIAVLEELLTTGKVDTHELSRKLDRKFSGSDRDAFDNACAVIKNYVETGEFGDSPSLHNPKNLTKETITDSLKRDGKPIEVTVQRSSGVKEKGWFITGLDPQDPEVVIVAKTTKDGNLQKGIPLEELKELNKEPEKIDQEEQEQAIAEAKSFEDLIEAIKKSGGIQGSLQFYSPKELENIINQVRKGLLSLDHVTRTGGLREKVKQLLEEEKTK